MFVRVLAGYVRLAYTLSLIKKRKGNIMKIKTSAKTVLELSRKAKAYETLFDDVPYIDLYGVFTDSTGETIFAKMSPVLCEKITARTIFSHEFGRIYFEGKIDAVFYKTR